MADPDFTSEERQVLGALMQPERRLADQTVDAMARDLGYGAGGRSAVPRGARGIAENSTDATLEVEFWIANNEAAEQLDQAAS